MGWRWGQKEVACSKDANGKNDVEFVSLVGNVTGSHCICQSAYLLHTQMQTAEEEEEERGKK